jgi:ubiquinone/menaquinone biosynthesis C-methylase UbiE
MYARRRAGLRAWWRDAARYPCPVERQRCGVAGKGARVAALDVAGAFITAAAGHHRSGICYVVGDGAALPFCASAFDAVTAFMSLMDVAEPERTLGEVARVLRPGGFVQFSVLHPVISDPGRVAV